MEDLIISIMNLLTTSPGNLVYHLVVGFSTIVALQAVILNKHTIPDITRSRTILGLSLLVLSQFGQFLATGFAWQGMADMHIFIPPLDRAIILFTIVVLVWMWNFPKPDRIGDFFTPVLIFAALIAFLLSLAAWSSPASTISFNGTWLDQLWVGAGALILVIALVSLGFKRPVGWGFGFVMLTVLLLGLTSKFFWFDTTSDFSGGIRLAQLITFPLLPTLTLRSTQPEKKPALKKTPTSTPIFTERRRHSADPRTVNAWLQVAANQESNTQSVQIARAVAQTMFADLCYLVTCQMQQGYLTLAGGYDLIREQALPPVQIEREAVPTIANVVLRGRSTRLGGEAGYSPDLPNLAREIGLEDCGSICLIPLINANYNWGAILLLSPYSDRNWTAEDQTYLSSSLGTITALLMRAPANPPTIQPQETAAQTSPAMVNLLSQLDSLKQENQLLLNEISIMRLEEQLAEPTDPILAQAKLERVPFTNVEQLEAQLRSSQEELARLQNRLVAADQNSRTASTVSDQSAVENREVMLSIIQELRQPLASLTGYTDLILSESVGILGSLQRKFMERIRISSERIRAMIDELIQVTVNPVGSTRGNNELVPVSEVIDEVVTENRKQIQEKNITFQIDFPETLPHLNIDRDAFVTIVSQLIQNAIMASPHESNISLRCSIESPENTPSFFLFQVTDQGGGILPADLPYVFEKRVKTEEPLIQGIGDTGMGLSIAKTLVEAHHGRIWCESESGKTTTISILIPIYWQQELIPDL